MKCEHIVLDIGNSSTRKEPCSKRCNVIEYTIEYQFRTIRTLACYQESEQRVRAMGAFGERPVSLQILYSGAILVQLSLRDSSLELHVEVLPKTAETVFRERSSQDD